LNQGRVVEYLTSNGYEQFTCNCEYLTSSGIICRHIFRVAAQLNLSSFPRDIYLNRWCKDPSDVEILQHYRRFYQNNLLEINNNNNKVEQTLEIDYNYLFNRTVWKVQDIVKANPNLAQLFYESLNGIINAHLNAISNSGNALKDISNLPIIKNPQNVKAKGRKSNKRKLSNIEQNSVKKRHHKVRKLFYFNMQ
jgi:hypothetical protein